jgi:hypothetical protein
VAEKAVGEFGSGVDVDRGPGQPGYDEDREGQDRYHEHAIHPG